MSLLAKLRIKASHVPALVAVLLGCVLDFIVYCTANKTVVTNGLIIQLIVLTLIWPGKVIVRKALIASIVTLVSFAAVGTAAYLLVVCFPGIDPSLPAVIPESPSSSVWGQIKWGHDSFMPLIPVFGCFAVFLWFLLGLDFVFEPNA